MVLPACGKRGQGGEINSKFAEECEPVSACVASVKILWLMQLRVCLVISTSPAQPSRHFRWSSFDWAQIRKIKQFSIVPRVPVPPPQPHPITGRLGTWLQFYFQTETMKNNLVEENIFLQLLWSVRLNVEWDCLWCPAWSSLEAAGREETIMRLQAWIIFHQVEN